MKKNKLCMLLFAGALLLNANAEAATKKRVSTTKTSASIKASDTLVDAYKAGDWRKAMRLAGMNDSNLETYMKFKYLTDTKSDASFRQLTDFARHHEDWPQMGLLHSRAEDRLKDETDKHEIMKWFSHHEPVTERGWRYYFYAASVKEKNAEKLNDIVKKAWIKGDFAQKECENILTKYSKILTLEDHVSKIDRLLWNKKVDEASKYLYLVKDDQYYSKAFQAWIDIISNKSKKIEKDFHKVKGSYRYHSGLLYAYLNLHSKSKYSSGTDAEKQELLHLILHAPRDSEHAAEWWKLRSYFARELIAIKDYKHAYEIVKDTGAVTATDITEAEFLAGWIALRMLKSPDLAIKHFCAVEAAAKMPLSCARALYWLGRSYAAKKMKDTSIDYYESAAEYGFTFYGQLAQHELGYKTICLPEEIKYNDQDKNKAKKSKYLSIAKFLAKVDDFYGMQPYFDGALLSVSEKSGDDSVFCGIKANGSMRYMVDEIVKLLSVPQGIELAKMSFQKYGIFIRDVSFPMPVKLPKHSIEDAWVYGLIRQESMFNQYIVEAASDSGLMQIIPETAKAVAKELGIKYDFKKLTQNAEYNLKIGTHYLTKNVNQFNGSYIMASAAYNGGPHRVPKWADTYGDPRKMDLHGVVDWIESIPLFHTRSYVQRVMENTQVYRTIITKNDKLLIERDLLRHH